MSKLYTTAVNILKESKGDMKPASASFIKQVKASPDLLNELATGYLSRVLADIRHGEQAQTGHARGREGPNRRIQTRAVAKLPTQEQKKSAVKIATAHAITILDTRTLRNGKPIGDVYLRELPALAKDAAQKAVSFLSRGGADAVDAIACHKLSLHVQPSGPDQRVRDAIKPSVVEAVYGEAELMAAQKIADASLQWAQDLLAEINGEGPPQIAA